MIIIFSAVQMLDLQEEMYIFRNMEIMRYTIITGQ